MGFKHSDETKEKISKALRGHPCYKSKKRNNKISKARKGGKLSSEHKEKISLGCKGKNAGEKSYLWKGGQYKSKGYVYIYSPKHPFANRQYVSRHRLIVEKQIGRYLLFTEICHHRNKIKDDNKLKNLMAFVSQSAHQRFHKNPSNVKLKEIIFDGRKLKMKRKRRKIKWHKKEK